MDEGGVPVEQPHESGTVEDGSIVIPLRQPSKPSDVVPACEEVCRRLEQTAADRLVCDVGGIEAADAMTLDLLARIQLRARRLGRIGLVSGAGPQLRELIALTGLDEVLRVAESGVEVGREPEERKELLRVEEEGDSADPAV